MKPFLLVATGGALGSAARYAVSSWVLRYAFDWRFPAGTFAVNIVGCLIAGFLAGLAFRYDCFSTESRLFVFTGILGGFTTFSAFSLETIQLLRKGEWTIAAANVFLSVTIGLIALWVAFRLVARK